MNAWSLEKISSYFNSNINCDVLIKQNSSSKISLLSTLMLINLIISLFMKNIRNKNYLENNFKYHFSLDELYFTYINSTINLSSLDHLLL